MTYLALALALAMPAAPPSPPPSDALSALETAVADAVGRAEPSVVAISREKMNPGPNEETTAVRGREPAPLVQPPVNPFGEEEDDRGWQSTDFGSGVVIGPDGAILTAFHVVRGATRLKVRAPGLKPSFDAEVLAADPRSDLAVIAPKPRADGRIPELTPMAMGDATGLRKGSFLLALGNPFNAAWDGRASASWGILANFARRQEQSMEDRAARIKQLRHHPTLLQLDSKLNLGMSGGAVVNLKGQLVGITTAGGDPAGFDAQAGYAIALDALGRRAVEALRQGKEVEYGFIGVGLSESVTNSVSKVLPGSPADLGGLLADDTILAAGGLPVTDSDSLTLAINAQAVGKPVTLKIRRGQEVKDKVVVLSKYPVQGEVIATNRPAAWCGLRVDFTSIVTGPMVADHVLEAMSKGGIGVVGVEPNTPADAAGLKPGQVIRAVNGKPVRTPSEFAEAVSRAKGPVRLDTDLGPRIVQTGAAAGPG